MCRQIAIPANFSRKETINILKSIMGVNTDGFGYSYVQNGKIIVKKWKKSFEHVLHKKGKDILNHLPHSGYTIIHMRLCSCGTVSKQSSHPFKVGNMVACHNGTWGDYELVKLALGKEIQYESDTDSEIGINLINKIGIKKFTNSVDYAGVFLVLNKSGYLWVSKTSGNLVLNELDSGQYLIASELPDRYDNQVEADEGWYCFNSQGKLVTNKIKPSKINIIESTNVVIDNDYDDVSFNEDEFLRRYGYSAPKDW